MLYRFSLFLISLLVFSGCSSKMPDSYYIWSAHDTIIHNKVIDLKSNSSDIIQVREIKYYVISKKNNKNGSTIYSRKNDRYLYLNPSVKLDTSDDTFKATSAKYKSAIVFYGQSTCRDSNYPCSFQSLRLYGEVLQNGEKSFSLSRDLTLSQPLRMTSESSMHTKVYNFLTDKTHRLNF